tara:strand:+ start:393 stop:893 length:501 start_codon:yes stop_codon:yes gene_type:complete
MTTYNKQGKSPFPLPFTYKDKFSAKGRSSKDLLISHQNAIIGKNSSGKDGVAQRLPAIGDNIIVVAENNKNQTFEVFCCSVREHTNNSESVRAWKNHGGLLWDFNYKVDVLSEIKEYTFDQMDNLVKNRSKVLNCAFSPRQMGTKITQVGIDRQSIFDDVMSTHKI